MMWWHGGVGWGGWLVMTLLMIAFWGLVIYTGFVIFGRHQEDGSSGSPQDRDPLRHPR
jgi:putative membrane protein